MKDKLLYMDPDFSLRVAIPVITNKILGVAHLSLVYICERNNESKNRF